MPRRLLIALLLSGCAASPVDNKSTQASGSLLDDHARRLMQLRPVRASRLGLDEEFMGGTYAHRIGDYGPEGMQRWRDTVGQMQTELGELYDGDIDHVTLDILADAYDRYAGASDIPYGYITPSGRHRPYIINQIRHPLRWITDSLVDYVAIDSEQDARAYISRLHGLSALSDQVLAKFQQDLQAGWTAPIELREKAEDWLQGFIAPSPPEHPLVASFATRLDKIELLGDEQRQLLIDEASLALEKSVYPGFKRVIAGVQASYHIDPPGDGVWALPMGEEFYRHAVYREAASTLYPEIIHQTGLREIQRILAEMDALLISVGREEGSVGDRLNALAASPEQLYEDSVQGRALLLADLNGMVGEISRRLPDYFTELPTQSVQIRAFPKLVQDSSPGGTYNRPSLDGSRPGIYTINLRSMTERARFTLKTLSYHEALPGHHLQVAVAMNQGGQPLLQRTQSVSAFSEGWALYAELLAAEMGMYDDDPLGDLGRLQAELWRAARLVMDTGLHFKRWSRERTIRYGMEVSGRPELTVTAEVERFMAWPGQALSYKLGMMAIVNMREDAREQLGEDFDLRAFHDLLTTGGAMTMPRLRIQVQQWVDSQK